MVLSGKYILNLYLFGFKKIYKLLICVLDIHFYEYNKELVTGHDTDDNEVKTIIRVRRCIHCGRKQVHISFYDYWE